MRIDVQTIIRTMESHLNEGLDNVCERLHYDDGEVVRHFASIYGMNAGALMTGAVAIGIDLGIELERSKQPQAVNRPDRETTANHDEFLATLPEAQKDYDGLRVVD